MTESTKIKLRWVVIITLTLLVFGTIAICERKFKYKMNQDIDENKGETIGVIIDYRNGGKSVSKFITYEYQVNGEKHEGSISDILVPELIDECEKQNCPNCIGAKFNVEYSTNNPQYS